ncbi:MAG: hypothetical protein ABR899_04710 [Candidatus Krumholzibacteriaceae bacterium]|jgi:hypothetical protein
MKPIVILAAIVLITSVGASRADPWQRSAVANLTLTQNGYSDSWIGGEAGSVSWTFNSNSIFERQFTPGLNNKNTLVLFFGQTHSENRDTKKWAKPVTSADQITFDTVFRFTLNRIVDPYASGRIETEFIDQSDPANERALNPVLFTESFGAAKVLTKAGKREWTARLGAGLREHLDRNVLDPASGDKRTQTSSDAGILFVSDFATPLADSSIAVTSRLSVYKAFYNSESAALEGKYNMDYWKAPDVDWEGIFTANITKYLMVNLYAELLYDKEVSLAGRFRQSLSLGVTYKLM